MSAQPTHKWIPRDTLAARIMLVRQELGLTQRDAAARCGIERGTWQGMEDGRSPRDLAEKVARISAALGVSREWLMWGGPLAPQGDPIGVPAPTSTAEGSTQVTVEYPGCPEERFPAFARAA